MAKVPKPSGYKKPVAPSPGAAKKQTILTYGTMGKGLNTQSRDIFHMGKK